MAVDSYRSEIEDFRKHFDTYKNKKIVIYGIGRYSATLLPEIGDFHVIGLMDKDESKIGTVLYGIPVISKADAKKQADMIIINTSGSYWDIIYHRISDLKVEVFYRNGEKARERKEVYSESYFGWSGNIEELKKRILEYDVISFDVYDTIWQRILYGNKCAFEYLDQIVTFDYLAVRNQAVAACEENASIDEIYEHIMSISGISKNLSDDLKAKEIEFESVAIRPRREIIQILKDLTVNPNKKEIYLISDMYLPVEFFVRQLEKYEICIPSERIWISGEKKLNKKSGSIWKAFQEKIVKGRNAIHIGDDRVGDIEMPRMFYIDVYPIPGKDELLSSSSLSEIVPKVTSLFTELITGLIANRLFENPFSLNHTKGKVVINDRKTFGYVVFGPIILTFLLWLLQECKEKEIENIYFFARDGFFLIDDYQELCSAIREKKPKATYLYTSRLLATIGGTEQGYENLLQLPYQGTLREYMEDRFQIQIPETAENSDTTIPQYAENSEKLYRLIYPYRTDIQKNMQKIKDNYRNYIINTISEGKNAFVDISYYGHTQEMISNILKKKTSAYYFHANLAETNPCRHDNYMAGCFQAQNDQEAMKSAIHNKCLLLEAFLTAPYGMVRAINENGDPICAPSRENQFFFSDKEEMNEGVKTFMKDYLSICKDNIMRISEKDRLFVDSWYSAIVDGKCGIADSVKRSFYNDNAMIHRESNPIME